MFSIFEKDSPVKSKNKHVQYADINFRFIEESRRVRFSCIFENEIQNSLERMLGHNFYRLPINYSDDSGKFEIHASRAEEFLNILLSLKILFGAEFIIGETEYGQFLSDLIKNGYLNPELKDSYLNRLTTDLTIQELEKLARAREHASFEEAVTIAKMYKKNLDDGDEFHLHSEESVLHWLIRAIRCQEDGFANLQKHIDLNKFLNTFTSLSSASFLFNKESLPLLQPLKNILTQLSFGTFFSPLTVNSHLGEFIANNNTLRSLDVSTTWSCRYQDRLNSLHMPHIAQGLKANSSLERLDLSDQPIGDEGLITLLEALASNPKTKLKSLNLFATGITGKGQEALEKFLQTNKTLQFINVEGNARVKSEQITLLTKKNRLASEELEKKSESMPIDKNIDSSLKHDECAKVSTPRGTMQ